MGHFPGVDEDAAASPQMLRVAGTCPRTRRDGSVRVQDYESKTQLGLEVDAYFSLIAAAAFV